MTGRRVFYEGRVQGVGFRVTVKHLARGYEVAGFVRNRLDGRVEVEASAGDPDELEAFFQSIRTSVLKAHIRGEAAEDIRDPVAHSGFKIADTL